MRLIPIAFAAILVGFAYADNDGWSWGEKKEPESGIASINQMNDAPFDHAPSGSEILEDYAPLNINTTDAERIVDDIIVSSRKGRNLDGYDEVYTDPNVQDALQKGDDSEARNIIKERLCHLGLMQCDEDIQGKRPYISPEDLQYAQPVAINPVGRPIPTIPIKGGPHRGTYGPPRPIPYPGAGGPPGKFGPPPGKYGPPNKFSPGPFTAPNKPPRRGYGPPPKPYYGGPNRPLIGEYDGPEYLSKPPHGAEIIESDTPPYAFEHGHVSSSHGHSSVGQFEHNYNGGGFNQKDKKVDIVVNANGGSAHVADKNGAGGVQQHVHHHFHHGADGASEGIKTPTVIVKPVPVPVPVSSGAFGSLSSHHTSGLNTFEQHDSFKPSIPLNTGFATLGQTSSGSYGSTYGSNYGSSALNGFDNVKPINENYGPQGFGGNGGSLGGNYGGNSFGASVGQYGSTGLYKKELNLNSVNSNYLQSNYADKYQGLESSRQENYDCVCVPYDQCPSSDIIGRKDDLYLAIDPRNLKSDIEAEEERVITDSNGNMTVIRVPKGANLNETLDAESTTLPAETETKKISKREATPEAASSTDEGDQKVEGRQFYQRPAQACGPRHVCCKRPLRPNVPSPGVAKGQCGVRHSQGINGRIKNPVYVDGDSEFGEYPWQVALLKKDSKESVYVCGGTLIDPLHIITAAHCVKTYSGFDLRARLGEWDVNHDVEFFPYIERDIHSVIVHPEFYAGTLYNDIAILRMDKPVDFGKHPHISPACLPNPHDDYSGTRCWTTGWGKDAFGDFGKYQNILKEVDVPVVGHAQCERQLQNTRLGYEFKLNPGFVCAGGEEGKDACKGDGGGPMVCERRGTMQLVGVVSWGIGCGQHGVPGVYVKVAHYLDWIRQVTQRY